MAVAAVFLVLACSLGWVLAVPTKRWSSKDPINTDVAWGSCTDFGVVDPGSNLSCGYYEVPMDYFDSSAGKARLALIKYQATAMSGRRGTLFVNPGGPGGSGIEFLSSMGSQFRTDVKGQFDIVSWDPRGVGSYTFPGDVTCFSTSAEQAAFWNNTVVRSINETISTNFEDPQELKEFYSHVPETDSKLEEYGKKCLASKTGPYLKYIGTTSTIRDLVSLGDKLVGPGNPIDYYGISYGTVIGFHFLTLFPNRVGRIILDGIVNPIEWGSPDLIYGTFLDSEEAFTIFTDACAQAGAAKCPPVGMIQGNVTGSDVHTLITSTVDLALKLQRLGYTGPPGQVGELKLLLFSGLYFPEDWPTFVNQQVYPALVAILTAGRTYNFTDPYILPKNSVAPLPETPSDVPARSSAEAITGADGAQSNGVLMKEVFEGIVRATRNRSPTFGAMWSPPHTTLKWPVRSVETLPTFTRKTLSNRVLVIGNSIDPLSPLKYAKYITQLLGSENAVLVENQAVGHTTLAQYSTCMHAIISNYLLNSTLPRQYTKCAADSNDFFPDTPTANIRRHLWHK